MLPDLTTRRKICEDTIKRSEEITATTPNASLHSTFITSQTYPELSPLDPVFPDLQLQPKQVIDSDTFACARSILSSDPEFRDKVAVLNLASDEEPGGGWRYTLSATQEEALCYSSTLYQTLKPEYYPWANTGPFSVAGIFSPGVVVFKDTLENSCRDLQPEERALLSVITIAAPRRPTLTNSNTGFADPNVLQESRNEIRLIFRCAAISRRFDNVDEQTAASSRSSLSAASASASSSSALCASFFVCASVRPSTQARRTIASNSARPIALTSSSSCFFFPSEIISAVPTIPIAARIVAERHTRLGLGQPAVVV
ncbi:hypothetical protein D6D24_02788 [Aureobasidium pullulans]|uniref:Microbial-type PARG catalytic domain-containing protein n=1 Tax=Aureobasidium pullulans TaxID=5580 RepID=A0A4S8W4M2_AURPU|nr:hypothetical protein D6D24_02788 [Aureobasidium pullulans]